MLCQRRCKALPGVRRASALNELPFHRQLPADRLASLRQWTTKTSNRAPSGPRAADKPPDAMSQLAAAQRACMRALHLVVGRCSRADAGRRVYRNNVSQKSDHDAPTFIKRC